MYGELEMIWEEVTEAYFSDFPRFACQTVENHELRKLEIRCTDRDSNGVPTAYKSVALPLGPTRKEIKERLVTRCLNILDTPAAEQVSGSAYLDSR
jgi:hypothetical protein